MRNRILTTACCLCLILCATLRHSAQNKNQTDTPPPTIKVTASYRVYWDIDSPGMETAEPYLTWETSNTDYVFILGSVEVLPPNGSRNMNGSFVFVAVGPGGTASQAIGAVVTSRAGTGIKNRIYSINTEFDEESFFRNAYKAPYQVNKSPEELALFAVIILQNLGYKADDTRKVQNLPIVFTLNHLPNNNLPNETVEERQLGINVRRNLDFIVYARAKRHFVLPVVYKNYPDDNRRKWIVDNDNQAMGITAASILSKSILEAAAR